MTGLFAEVVVDLPVRRVDRIFHYRIPAAMDQQVFLGSRVRVSFNGRMTDGFVVGFSSPEHKGRIKEISAIIEARTFLNEEMIGLARWLAEHYLCTLAAALHCVAGPPAPKTRRARPAGMVASRLPEELTALTGLARAPKQRLALEVALAKPGLSKKELARAAGVSVAVVDALLAKGWLVGQDSSRPAVAAGVTTAAPVELTEEQRTAVQKITLELDSNRPKAVLLHGVTGSGKTEVYLRAIEHCLERQKQVIMLVPEIALTPQMVDQFRSRFGSRVAVLHSRLAQGEKYLVRQGILSGETPVVLGARSAVFAPVSNLGLIILDEEHEPSYKQEDAPKYHARTVAMQRAACHQAVVLLGSATPALETYCRAWAGSQRYGYVPMLRRVDGRPMPKVRLADMRQELTEGNRSIFSRLLIKTMRESLANREQVILFINRRGFANFVICRECGLVLNCPHCDISLTYHRDGVLRCHYCNYQMPMPVTCPDCGSRYIRYFGIGTQRVEEEITKIFPGIKTLRMDRDTTARKGSHERLLAAFRDHQADVLIGTQMIAKGLHLPRVTLVGVVSADTSLHIPDFRAAERTFQLLTQVAGRAGRGSRPGEVVIQTYDPDHYSIKAAQNHDYSGFLAQELPLRKALLYPPFSLLAKIVLSDDDALAVDRSAGLFQDIFAGLPEVTGVELLGPAPLPRIKDRYQVQFILKGRQQKQLRDVCRRLFAGWDRVSGGKLHFSIDIE